MRRRKINEVKNPGRRRFFGEWLTGPLTAAEIEHRLVTGVSEIFPKGRVSLGGKRSYKLPDEYASFMRTENVKTVAGFLKVPQKVAVALKREAETHGRFRFDVLDLFLEARKANPRASGRFRRKDASKYKSTWDIFLEELVKLG
ncbi:MAG: hypothetical protein ABIH20_03875 [Candidatus Diapherotrites archaeon]